MDNLALRAELARPAYLRLALLLVLLVSTTAAVVAVFIVPAREALQEARESYAALSEHRRLASELSLLREDVSYWASVVPGMTAKLDWRGSASDFSGAILDAATLANVRLDKEVNEVRSGETHRIYSKTLYFKAQYAAVDRFIAELARLDLLVVPGKVSLAPAGEGDDRLGVTLVLTGYAEMER
ncbi:MAG: hypothetical protein SV598_11840 [Pseudomonadota bacterium]|nr:hypothetical protein [Pseudomonadota bacterium]